MDISKEGSILIIFIENFNNIKEDDKVYITKKKICYVPSKENHNSKCAFEINAIEDIFKYISLLSRLLINDKDPFHGIQIFIPGFPSIMFDNTDLNAPIIRNILQEAITYWYQINGKSENPDSKETGNCG